MNVDKNNLDKLTDDELFKALKEVGLNVGPITSTTRSIYERRLKNFLDAHSPETEPPAEQTHEKVATNANKLNTSVHGSLEEAPINQKPPTPKPDQNTFTKSTPEEIKKSEYQPSFTYETDTPRIRGRAPMHRRSDDESSPSDSSKKQKQAEKSSGFSFRYAIICVLAVVIIYYIIQQFQNNSFNFIEV